MSTTIADNVYKTTPYGHQEQALTIGAERNSFGYLMEMGTGKSKVLIDNLCNGVIGLKEVLLAA